MIKSIFIAASAVLLWVLPAGADQRQEIILKAIEQHAGSIVKVEFECRQSDGKGARKYSLSGVVVSADGLVMVSDVNQIDPPVGGRYQKPEEYTIIFEKEVKAKASFLGKDEELNLGLLRIKKEEPEEGEKAPVIRPLPLPKKGVISLKKQGPLSMADEIIILSRLSKTADYEPTFRLMRVTAVVKKPTGPPDYRVSGSLGGLTGCPVLTMDGRVVGFVGRTSVEPSSGGRSVTIGGRTYRMGGRSRRGSPRILCAESFKEFLADPSKFLRRRCWLGVRGLQAFSKDLAEHLEVAEKGGVILGEVLKQSPAAKAGLRDRDIVVKINGEKLDITEDRDVEKLRKRVQRGRAGDVLVLSILRDSDQGLKEVEVRLTLEEEPVREFEVEDWEEKTFGLRVKPLTRDFLDKGRLPLDTKGVRVTYVESAGWAYLAGVRSGDIIKDVVLEKTPDLAAFQKRMKQVIETREPEVCFGITRRGKSLFLCVRPQWELDAKKGEKEE